MLTRLATTSQHIDATGHYSTHTGMHRKTRRMVEVRIEETNATQTCNRRKSGQTDRRTCPVESYHVIVGAPMA